MMGVGILYIKLKCVKAIELNGRRFRAGYFSDTNELLETTTLDPFDFRLEPGEFITVSFEESCFANAWKRCVFRETKPPK